MPSDPQLGYALFKPLWPESLRFSGSIVGFEASQSGVSWGRLPYTFKTTNDLLRSLMPRRSHIHHITETAVPTIYRTEHIQGFEANNLHSLVIPSPWSPYRGIGGSRKMRHVYMIQITIRDILRILANPEQYMPFAINCHIHDGIYAAGIKTSLHIEHEY